MQPSEPARPAGPGISPSRLRPIWLAVFGAAVLVWAVFCGGYGLLFPPRDVHVEYVYPDGFIGAVHIVEHPTGAPLVPEQVEDEDRYRITVPPDGLLVFAEPRRLMDWHSETHRYASGSTIELISYWEAAKRTPDTIVAFGGSVRVSPADPTVYIHLVSRAGDAAQWLARTDELTDDALTRSRARLEAADDSRR